MWKLYRPSWYGSNFEFSSRKQHVLKLTKIILIISRMEIGPNIAVPSPTFCRDAPTSLKDTSNSHIQNSKVNQVWNDLTYQIMVEEEPPSYNMQKRFV